MKRVVLFYEGRLFPSAGGTSRVVADIARFLHAQPEIRLTLVVLDGRMTDEDESRCREICHTFVRLRPAPRWSPVGILNALAHRLGTDVHAAYFRARALRRRMQEICAEADCVLVNFAAWYPLLPRAVRQRKVVVITHDLLFQRRASFRGGGFWLKVCRWFELRVLASFRRVAVFADYERDLLTAAGLPTDRIVRLGMPIVCAACPTEQVHKDTDFLLLGGKTLQNEEALACFFARVVPLVGARKVSLTVAGDLCSSPIWNLIAVPANVCVRRLGFVADLRDVCVRARIGVSTPTHGSGVKVKTVECIEYGLPMVLTDCGEEGVPVLTDGAVNIDRTSSEAASARLCQWLDHPESAAEVGRRQAEKVRRAFAPETCLTELMSLMEG